MKKLFVVPVVMLVTACGSVQPSVVKMVTDNRAFVGETSDSFFKDGEFTVSSAKGVTCNGTFEFVKEISGTGTISCSDKRSGAFVFTAQDSETGRVLKGYGEFKDGQKFEISFGKEESKERYYYSGRRTPQPIYEGKPPAYNGQFEFDI